MTIRRARGVVVAALVAAGEVGVAQAQTLGAGGAADPQVSWWRVILALVFCLLLAAGAAYAVRASARRGGFSRMAPGQRPWPTSLAGALKILAPEARRLRLVETLRLSHQVDVCLIRCDDLELAVAASPHGATLLFTRPAQAPVDAAPSEGGA